MNNNKISFLFALLFSLSTCFSFAVKSEIKTCNANDDYLIKITKAWYKLNEKDYNGALRIYRDLYQTRPNDPKLNYRLGLCYFNLDKMEEAIGYFEKSREINPYLFRDLPFLLGQSYQSLGVFDKAITEYTIYKSLLFADENKRLIEVYELLEQCRLAKKLTENPVNVVVTNLGNAINSQYDDAIPLITANKKTLIFTSRRPEKEIENTNPDIGFYNDDIYYSTWNESNRTWNKAENMGTDLNTTGHDACLYVSEDNTIFVYKNIPQKTRSGDIYYATQNTSGKWTNPKSIGKAINSSYFESSACLSPDGKTLYFVSERKGGRGNADIYQSHKISENEWTKPENLGNNINTINDELGVFMHPDGKTLFFSSKGHNSIGGYDIFASRYENGEWSEPVNLGYPINTTEDELHFIVSADNRTAYISSRRENGLGGADIYEINLANYKIPFGETKETAMNAKEEDEGGCAKINMAIAEDVKKLSDKDIELTNKVNELGSKVSKINNDVEEVKELVNIMYNASKEKKDITKMRKEDVAVGATFDLNNIFFDSGKSDLRPESTTELDKLVKILNDFSTIKIQIDGHTDDQGSPETNLKLSENRAKAVVNYLIGKGIDANRLTFKGYGSGKPVALNATEEDRQKNRRTEIVIIEK